MAHFVLAAALLTTPPGIPDPAPDAADWLAVAEAMQTLAVEWEILDPREVRYVLARLDDWDNDLTMLRRYAEPGDGIVYGSTGNEVIRAALRYYLGDRLPRDLLLVRTAEENRTLTATECADPAACVGTTRRVWLVVRRHAANPLAGRPSVRALLTADYTRIGKWATGQDTLALYERIH